jgi:hypothetical protein
MKERKERQRFKQRDFLEPVVVFPRKGRHIGNIWSELGETSITGDMERYRHQ